MGEFTLENSCRPSSTIISASTSSDEGIREENIENMNMISSSTLNDYGFSLNSTPSDSNVALEKSRLTVQTFLNYKCSKITVYPDFKTFTSHFEISRTFNKLVQTNFQIEICPQNKSLSSSITFQLEIPERNNTLELENTKKLSRLSIQTTLEQTTITPRNLSIDTFHQNISFKTNTLSTSQMSKNLDKLGEQLSSLQSVFKNFKITRDLSKTSILSNSSKTKMKTYNFQILKMESTSAQTIEFSFSQHNFGQPSKIETLNLDCEFFMASGDMIKHYPFYYEFLNKCYNDSNFARNGKLRFLRPMQANFKKAVIRAVKKKKSHLATINSILQGCCDKNK
ncbi:hypothetical protein HHI36_012044 [Cryptolaemus montrouzieri]|uniref:Uncharacterized protein n=1 Tax=Cryptolaemus montrouzieri TaxID=559131 RepID=A0ABD2NDM0_9CUCU